MGLEGVVFLALITAPFSPGVHYFNIFVSCKSVFLIICVFDGSVFLLSVCQ